MCWNIKAKHKSNDSLRYHYKGKNIGNRWNGFDDAFGFFRKRKKREKKWIQIKSE